MQIFDKNSDKNGLNNKTPEDSSFGCPLKWISVSSKSKTKVYFLFDLFFKYGIGTIPFIAFLFSWKYELEAMMLPFIFGFINILSLNNLCKSSWDKIFILLYISFISSLPSTFCF